jgi:hypothetical protein
MKALCFVRLKIYKDLTVFNHEGSLQSCVLADNVPVSSSVNKRTENPRRFREKPCIVTVLRRSVKLRSYFCVDSLCTKVIKWKLSEYHTALFSGSRVI